MSLKKTRAEATPENENLSEPEPSAVLPPDTGGREPNLLLRFRKEERLLHWAIAVPFMLCFISALALVLVYNPEPQRPLRALFSWIHKISGASLLVLPMLSFFSKREGIRTHLANIRHAWNWTRDDIKWLLLRAPSIFSKRISLPEEGKFNAGEKLNFVMVTLVWPLIILTGLSIWIPDEVPLIAWLAHFALALLYTPFMFGHIFLATINPDTKKSLQGMISGFVDRRWAKHHHRKWYREISEPDSPDEEE